MCDFWAFNNGEGKVEKATDGAFRQKWKVKGERRQRDGGMRETPEINLG